MGSARRTAWWRWPTVLSLDAPAVVVGWQAVVAKAAQVPLAWPHAFVLAASVWLAYAADRLFEGWRLDPDAVRTARHAFYQRWRWTVFVSWFVVLACDLSVALTHLSLRELDGGWLVVPPVLAYLLSHQLVHRTRRWRAPKEVCVALLLGAGVALFPLAQEQAHYASSWPALALFVLLCFANCALISAWERDVDRSHGQTSLALQFRNTGWIHALPWILALAAATLGLWDGDPLRVAAACTAVSAALLGVVDRQQPRLGWRLARVLADVALMTPFIAMALGQL